MFDFKSVLIQAKEENPKLFKKDLSIIEYSNKILSNAEIISSHSKRKLEGFIAFYLGTEKDNFAYVTFIYVEKKFRGQGVAEFLIESALVKIDNYGLKACRLEVGNNNKNAKKLYAKKGFKIIQELGNTLVMEKNWSEQTKILDC